MTRFIKVDDMLLNTDTVARACMLDGGILQLTLTDGTRAAVSAGNSARVMKELTGSDWIVSLYRQDPPVYNLYAEQRQGPYYGLRCDWVSLTADGKIHQMLQYPPWIMRADPDRDILLASSSDPSCLTSRYKPIKWQNCCPPV